jgi:predicted lactoylglutathione lyase
LIPIVQNSQKGLGSKTKQDTQVHNFCEVCNKIIPEASWASHLNGKKHKHRVHYVQMLEQLAPHLLPEERHQLLDEDEESKDEEKSTREIINTDANNSTTVNTTVNNNHNNGQSGAAKEQQNSENLNSTQTVTLTTSTIATNNTLHPKFFGPMPKPVPVYNKTSTQTNAPKVTAAQLAQPVNKPHQAPGRKINWTSQSRSLIRICFRRRQAAVVGTSPVTS